MISDFVWLRKWVVLLVWGIGVFVPYSYAQTASDYQTVVVINEFMASNSTVIADEAGQYEDWIELYNNSASPIDVAGWHLTDSLDNPTKWAFPLNQPGITTIAPHDFILIWADEDIQDGPLHADFKLGKSGEELGLFDTQGAVVDRLAFTKQQDNVSWGRFPDGAATWQEMVHPTPMAPNQLGSSSGSVVIDEIMYHPFHEFQQPEPLGLEFIELYNSGMQTIDLSGWRFTRGVEYLFPNGTTLTPEEYLVVAADVDLFQAHYPGVSNVVGGWSGHLSNSGETIELCDQNDQRIDRIKYSDQGPWSQRILGPVDTHMRGWLWQSAHDGGGRSLECRLPTFAHEYGEDWQASLIDGGTPGQRNSVDSSSLPPIIHGVEHAPIIPNSQTAVTVRADIVAQVPLQSVVLYYRIDTSSYQRDVYPLEDLASFTAVPMMVSAKGKATGQIPAQPHGSVVEYFVEAVDTNGQHRTWPAPSEVDGTLSQVTNALYQVDDTFDEALMSTPGMQPHYYCIMTATEKGRLVDIGDNSNSDYNSDAQMNATFISVTGSGIDCRYTVGIRNRGHGSRHPAPNNYRVNFLHDEPWNGVTEINLNARYPYLQVAGSALMHMASLPVADARIVQLRINGENMASTSQYSQFGVYAHVEVINSDFADKHFPLDSSGNLYKCMRVDSTGEQANLRYLGSDPDVYRNKYFKQSNGSLEDWSDLIGLTATLALDASDSDYRSSVEAVADADQWLRFLAINTIFNNRETSLANGNGDDYYLYRGIQDPRFILIQHDLDTILGQGNTGSSPQDTLFPFRDLNSGIDVLTNLISEPAYASRYYEYLQELCEGPLSVEQARSVLEPLLGSVIPENLFSSLLNYLDERDHYILSQIPHDFAIQTDLPQQDGAAVTDQPTVVLYGSAPALKTRSVLVNGILAYWDALRGTWTLDDSQDTGKRDTLVEPGAVWSYNDQGEDLGTDWFVSPDFESWPSGPAELGYGDGDEATVVGYVDSDPSTSTVEKNITTYFVHAFDVTDPTLYDHLSLRILRDDGAVVYLNGSELARTNMPDGEVNDLTRASSNVYGGDSEITWVGDPSSGENLSHLDASLLRAGKNVLAVEVHQVLPSSVDISFNLELAGVSPSEGLLSLQPGLNRITAQTFDGPDGTGHLLQQDQMDIWYDAGTSSSLGGTLTSDTRLEAASGPWVIDQTLQIGAGVTLIIDPGTSLFFTAGAGIDVQPGGRLVAEGSEWQHIRMTHLPGQSGDWEGVLLNGSLEDNRIGYVDFEYGDGQGESLAIHQSRVQLDHVVFSGTNKRVLDLNHPRALIQHCVFPSIGSTEPLHGSGLAGDEYLVFDSCTFGTATGYNDIIDFTGGQRPGPILQMYNNTFLGGTDDGLDLDGTDAHIEGNLFMHFHSDASSDSTSNAIATGRNGNDTADLVVARNTFVDCDHSVLLKEGCYMHAQNNTFVDNTIGAVSFGEPFRNPPRTPGLGALLENNIFWNNADIFENNFQEPEPDYGPTELDLLNNIVPVPWDVSGFGNVAADPLLTLANPNQVLSDSIAVTGLDGDQPMGSWVGPGARVIGEPASMTYRADALLTVTGPGITQYQYSLDDPNGPWSDVFAINVPIALNNLSPNVSHQVYVLGQNSAGRWQGTPTVSDVWTVDPAFSRLAINEVLVLNQSVDVQGRQTGFIELIYDGPGSLSLSGYSLETTSLTQSVALPDLTVAPGDLVVLASDSLGLDLDPNGTRLSLIDPGQQVVDSVEFGHQLPDRSIGRIGRGGQWTLTTPTPGQSNLRCALGDAGNVCLNEWLASSDWTSDFVELYNPQDQPVAIGGFCLTDEPVGWPDQQPLPPLSFIEAQGYWAVALDQDLKLSSVGETLGLFDHQLRSLDRVVIGPQARNISQGRSPDGALNIVLFAQPTLGQPNSSEVVTEPNVVDSVLVPMDQTWSYHQENMAPDADWMTTAFNDSGWPTGPALLYVEGSSLPASKNTPLTLGSNAYYFRSHFTVDQNLQDVQSLRMETILDDGAIVYLNGQEILRLGMPDGPVEYSTYTNRTVGNAVLEGPFEIPLNVLKTGDNVLAVEVHQHSADSSDIVFGLDLTLETLE